MFPRARLHRLRSPALAGSLVATLGLVACGGGGGESSPAPAPEPTTTAVPVKVVDGPLRNAQVCVDLNDNGRCDTGEPTARTDAGGAASLDVPNAEVGKHAVLAFVGTDAVDADFGPVTAPFVLTAPAGRSAVVSPLTTLVATQMQVAAIDATQAEALVRGQLGLSGSLFTDYSAATEAAAGSAKLVARMAVLTVQEQARVLAGIVGTSDIGGTAISQADVDRAVQRALLAVLPALGAVAVDPAIQGAANPDAALRAQAQDIVANRSELTATTAAAVIGGDRLLAQAADPGEDPPGPTATLRALRYDGPGSWYYRAMAASAADRVADANGLVRYYDLRRATLNGAVETWGFANSYARRGDVLWTGGAWAECPFGTRNTLSVRDATGFTRYSACNGWETGTGTRAARDISGQSLAAVVAEIRKQPGSDSGVPYAAWGPTDLSVLGNAVMPAGSKLFYSTSQSLKTNVAYDVTARVPVAFPAVAAGARLDETGAACRQITALTPVADYLLTATSLDIMMERNRGTPCSFARETNATGNSGSRNEWWGQSTVFLDRVAGAATPEAGTGDFYTTTREIRVAFTGPGQVTYYNCIVRRTGGSTGRNCDVAGRGGYTLETLGDARVLTLTSPPPSAATLGYDRAYVERSGVVWYGYRLIPRVFRTVRLNLPAANALLGQIGLEALRP